MAIQSWLCESEVVNSHSPQIYCPRILHEFFYFFLDIGQFEILYSLCAIFANIPLVSRIVFLFSLFEDSWQKFFRTVYSAIDVSVSEDE